MGRVRETEKPSQKHLLETRKDWSFKSRKKCREGGDDQKKNLASDYQRSKMPPLTHVYHVLMSWRWQNTRLWAFFWHPSLKQSMKKDWTL